MKICGGGPGSGGKRDGAGRNKGAAAEVEKGIGPGGIGPGSGGPRDNSGGKRVGAGRHKGAAAEVEKGIGPGVDKVRKQHNLPSKPTYDETGCFCVPHCSCDRCPEQKQKVAILSCVQHTTRYGTATNSVMSMDHTEEEIELLIEKCIHVPDGTKDRLQKEWETEHMAHDRPFPACAACGIRSPHHATKATAVGGSKWVNATLQGPSVLRMDFPFFHSQTLR